MEEIQGLADGRWTGNPRLTWNLSHFFYFRPIVEKQQALRTTIIEAIASLMAAIQVKEELAQQQDSIQTGDVGRPYRELSPAGVRHAYLQEITKRLQVENGKPALLALANLSVDWSCRRMSSQGDLA